ncbi:MAG TPA: RNA polymerase factor sigma-54 [Spirochaetota bacterium]|nr:RNA polymerase factor sigma-54 [Spirochaetota bacterium]HPJ37330.1 RNA polymerase factor sigma-54 [Spirochaetota bacterium]HPQ51892.1 RNA polymerase factor sigma-54 [Spirochaetota bacterium]
MAVSIKLGLKQSQRLALTQSLRQSIELLQLSTLELSQRISSELLENPVLEEENVSLQPSISLDEGNLIGQISRELSGEKESYSNEENEKLTYSDPPDSGYSSSRAEDRKRDFIENTVAYQESLKEHLMWQARLSAGNSNELTILENIITSIDDNGFLVQSLEELAQENNTAPHEIEKLLNQIQEFDPIGCGVHSLQESLIVQAMYFFPDDDILRSLLEDHFLDMEKLNYEKIAKTLNISVADVIETGKKIQNLDPFPGRQYSQKNARYITPDVEVRYLDGEIIINMNDEWIPSITINSYYLDLLRKKSIEKNIREYIQDKVQSARYLIKSISGRRDTIIKVVNAIMEHQIDFLARGPGHLKPLVHTDIAQQVGMHESTISRVTSNKFVQTSWGVFELKYFFVSRIKSTDTEDRSSDEVMNLIKDIIAGEKPENPFSDEEILARLNDAGIDIARRTIAKYRGILNIPSSNKRKKLNMIKTKGSL